MRWALTHARMACFAADMSGSADGRIQLWQFGLDDVQVWVLLVNEVPFHYRRRDACANVPFLTKSCRRPFAARVRGHWEHQDHAAAL